MGWTTLDPAGPVITGDLSTIFGRDERGGGGMRGGRGGGCAVSIGSISLSELELELLLESSESLSLEEELLEEEE